MFRKLNPSPLNSIPARGSNPKWYLVLQTWFTLQPPVINITPDKFNLFEDPESVPVSMTFIAFSGTRTPTRTQNILEIKVCNRLFEGNSDFVLIDSRWDL